MARRRTSALLRSPSPRLWLSSPKSRRMTTRGRRLVGLPELTMDEPSVRKTPRSATRTREPLVHLLSHTSRARNQRERPDITVIKRLSSRHPKVSKTRKR